jgi:hypothetical protein
VLESCARAPAGELELPEGTTVREAVLALGVSPEMSWLAVLEDRLTPADTPLSADDEVYVFLPLSGG